MCGGALVEATQGGRGVAAVLVVNGGVNPAGAATRARVRPVPSVLALVERIFCTAALVVATQSGGGQARQPVEGLGPSRCLAVARIGACAAVDAKVGGCVRRTTFVGDAGGGGRKARGPSSEGPALAVRAFDPVLEHV